MTLLEIILFFGNLIKRALSLFKSRRLDYHKHFMAGPEGNSEFCRFPRISIYSETKSRETLRGCPPKIRPLTSDQNFDFLQNFSTKQGLYKVKENTFLWFLFLIIVEILRRM